jgi:hypothetical protein
VSDCEGVTMAPFGLASRISTGRLPLAAWWCARWSGDMLQAKLQIFPAVPLTLIYAAPRS